MSIKISVVVPTYKRPSLLSKCIDALLLQDFASEEYEIIVVSDGPDAATASLIGDRFSTIADQVRYLSLQAKKGPAAARNLGWTMARGELIAFIDDDCIPDTDWLSRFWMAYAQHGETLISFTGQVTVPIPEQPTDYEKNIAFLEVAEFITANCACTKSALKTVGGFDETFTMAWREDSDLHFKLLRSSIPLYKISAARVIHPVRTAKFGVSLKEQKKSMFNALLFRKFPDLYRQRISEKPLWNYYGMILAFAVAIVAAFCRQWALTSAMIAVWLTLVLAFMLRRLRGTDHSPRHIIEMAYTSALIPFYSIYWTLYGSFKYKKLLL